MNKEETKKYTVTIAICLLCLLVLNVTGCSSQDAWEEPQYLQRQETEYDIIVDEENCVEYFVSFYRFSVRLNADGKPILNELCLKEKEK